MLSKLPFPMTWLNSWRRSCLTFFINEAAYSVSMRTLYLCHLHGLNCFLQSDGEYEQGRAGQAGGRQQTGRTCVVRSSLSFGISSPAEEQMIPVPSCHKKIQKNHQKETCTLSMPLHTHLSKSDLNSGHLLSLLFLALGS